MPEGQVSHRNAITLRATLVGKPLVRVKAPDPRLAPQRIDERLDGDVVSAAEARGKHHLLRFESGRTLHSHLLMSGRWIVRAGHEPPWTDGLTLSLATDRHIAALYRCREVRLLEPDEPLPRWVAATGPDLIDADDPAGTAAARLSRVEPTRQVGDVLMDQRVLSGIGNVYKSETCFLAGVDPWRSIGSLSDEEAADLGRIAAELLRAGVRQRGGIRTYAPPGGPSFGGGTKWVYGRRGKPCRRCGEAIRSRGQGDSNRTTYWCPACQR